jgi:hypothetical protein
VKRIILSVEGRAFLLAQNTDVDELKQQILATMRAGGGFLELVVLGNRSVSILVSPSVSLTVESEDVEFDARDSGDLALPFEEDDQDDGPRPS